jgi:hypothetical protein
MSAGRHGSGSLAARWGRSAWCLSSPGASGSGSARSAARVPTVKIHPLYGATADEVCWKPASAGGDRGGAGSGVLRNVAVTWVCWSATTTNARVHGSYPSNVTLTAREPMGTFLRTSGVCPSLRPLTMTSARGGCDVTVRDPRNGLSRPAAVSAWRWRGRGGGDSPAIIASFGALASRVVVTLLAALVRLNDRNGSLRNDSAGVGAAARGVTLVDSATAGRKMPTREYVHRLPTITPHAKAPTTMRCGSNRRWPYASTVRDANQLGGFEAGDRYRPACGTLREIAAPAALDVFNRKRRASP